MHPHCGRESCDWQTAMWLICVLAFIGSTNVRVQVTAWLMSLPSDFYNYIMMQQIRLCLTSDATNLRDIIASHAQSSWHMWQPGFPIFMNLCFRNPWSQICDTCGRWVILSPHRSINTKSQYSQDFRANYADLGCEISYSGDKKRKMLRCVF